MGRKPKAPQHLTPITLDEAAAAFLRLIKSKAAPESTTVRNKAVIMRGLIAAMGGDREVWTLRSSDFTETLTWITEGASPEEAAQREKAGLRRRPGLKAKGSRTQARVTLRQFAEFCHHYRYLDPGNTMVKLDFGATNKVMNAHSADRPRLAHEEWGTALELAERRHMRMRIVVAFGLFYARRVSEITALRWKNIRLDDDRPSIDFSIVKRGKRVVMPMLPEMYSELLRYREWYTERCGEIQPDWYVVPARVSTRFVVGAGSRAAFLKDPSLYPVDPTQRANHVGINTDVRHVLGAWGYGPGEGTGTHTFRRSAARHIAQTYGLEVAQALLGHQSISTTEVYVGGINEYEIVDNKLGGVRRDAVEQEPNNVIPLRRVV